jgi:hypothetical protein
MCIMLDSKGPGMKEVAEKGKKRGRRRNGPIDEFHNPVYMQKETLNTVCLTILCGKPKLG